MWLNMNCTNLLICILRYLHTCERTDTPVNHMKYLWSVSIQDPEAFFLPLVPYPVRVTRKVGLFCGVENFNSLVKCICVRCWAWHVFWALVKVFFPPAGQLLRKSWTLLLRYLRMCLERVVAPLVSRKRVCEVLYNLRNLCKYDKMTELKISWFGFHVGRILLSLCLCAYSCAYMCTWAPGLVIFFLISHRFPLKQWQ